MKRARRPKVGATIGADLTVIGILRGGDEPVTIVWHHGAWCPMACKIFPSFSRARREAEILALLAHPNTVRFLGLVRPAHLLMEFLEGPTLSRLIRQQKRGRLAVSDALRVAIHLGAALSHIHAKGFLHLDVKPSNIIVARGRPVLYDFGSARRQGARRPPHIAGTDPYIAPEECRRETVGTAADVFSLGVTLYEMLTGALPFGEPTRRRPFPQIDKAPLSVRRHRRGIAARLDALVLRCLARDPADRPTIGTLLPALHEFVRGRPMWPARFRPDRARPRAKSTA